MMKRLSGSIHWNRIMPYFLLLFKGLITWIIFGKYLRTETGECLSFEFPNQEGYKSESVY